MECDEDDGSYTETGKPNHMWVEARSVYIQLKSLVDSLKVSHDDDSGGLMLTIDKYIHNRNISYPLLS